MPTNPKEYMREYQRKRRAKKKLEKQKVEFERQFYPSPIDPSIPVEEIKDKPINFIPEGCSPVTAPDLSFCRICFSKHVVHLGGFKIKCLNCGIEMDLSERFFDSKGVELI